MADNTIESTVILKANSTEAVKSIKDLRNNVNIYKNDLVQLDEGSEKYNATLNKLAESQGALNNIQRDARAVTMNLTDQYAQLTRIAAGVSGGFGVLSSATALLGNDNKELAETLVRVQAGLALTQQLTTLSSGIKAANLAFKSFNATLAANPYSAILVALVAIGAAFGTLASIVFNNDTETKKLDETYKDLTKSLEETNIQFELNYRLLKAQGIAETEIIRQRIADTEKTQSLIQDEIAAVRAQIKVYQGRNSIVAWGNRQAIKAQEEYLKKLEDDLKEYNRTVEKLNGDLSVALTTEDKRREDDRLRNLQQANRQREAEIKRFNEIEEKAQQNYANTLENIEKEKQKRITDAFEGTARLNFVYSEIEANQQLQEILLKNATEETATWQERDQAAKDYQQALRDGFTLEQERAKLEEDINNMQIKAEEDLNQKLEQQAELERLLELARNPESLTFEERIQRLREEANERLEFAQKDVHSYEERKQAIDEYIKKMEEAAKIEADIEAEKERLRRKTLGSIATFLTESSKLVGENTVAQKSLAVAGATINTYLAGTLALATYPPPASYAALAATIATGLATVKNILSTNVPGASDSATTSTASLPTMPELASPIVETHNNLDSYDEEVLNQRPVLVVEDVNEVQRRVEVAVNEATY